MKTERLFEWIISIPLFILLFPTWLMHCDMLRTSYLVKKLKRATYSEIKEKMLSTEWVFNWHHPCSLFSKNDEKAYFHASIFQWDGIGYQLTPYGYVMASLLQRKIRKSLDGYDLYKRPYID